MSAPELEQRRFIRRANAFVPADVMSEELFAGIPLNATVLLGIRKPRNIEHHRRLFALLRLAVQNSSQWADETVLLDDLKSATGLSTLRFDVFSDRTYRQVDSISFAAMSQARFEPWYAKAVQLLSEHLGLDVEALLDEVERLSPPTKIAV